jgi:hypothetical protein
MDTGFLDEISALGGESIRKCYQCGSCTANCPLTDRIKAFPRRTLRLVQLGLAEKAVQSPDIWLCSACTTCKAACPRGADPGEIMAALRRYAYRKYSWQPRFTRSLSVSPKIFAAIAAFTLAALLTLVFLVSQITQSTAAVDFAILLPFPLVDAAGMTLGLSVVFGISMSSLRMWKIVGRSSAEVRPKLRQRFGDLVKVGVFEVALQRTLRKCNTGRLQWSAHLSLIVGFIGAGATTLLVFLLSPGGEPFPLDNPVKILGNISAALLLFGGGVLITRRLLHKGTVGKTYLEDGLFISILLLVAVTGTLSEVGRLANVAVFAYPAYAIHLVSTALLLGLAPYTKFAHAIYRPLAMYIAKLRGWPD